VGVFVGVLDGVIVGVGVGVALGKKLIQSSIENSLHPFESIIVTITAGAKSNKDGSVKITAGGIAADIVPTNVELLPYISATNT
jgi:hypothetical protein